MGNHGVGLIGKESSKRAETIAALGRGQSLKCWHEHFPYLRGEKETPTHTGVYPH